MTEAATRGRRRSAVGKVTSDKMSKTRRVEIEWLVKHQRYGKYIRRRTICYVHDEKNESKKDDKVEIVESRPMSKMKRWRLVRVLTKAPRAGEETTVAEGGKAKVPQAGGTTAATAVPPLAK